MGNEVTLNIVLEGTGPGLEDGRLSLSYFNDSFRELLRAYRGIATMLISSAQYDDVNTRAQGRRPKLAEQMDLEIDSIAHHSPPMVRLICAMPRININATNELFAKDIIKRSATELVDAVDAEARGNLRNKYVRRFLEKLPPGTKNQFWELYDEGKLVKTITVSGMQLPQAEIVGAGIIRVEGRISGIHFAPSGEIRITANDTQWWFKSSDEQIEKALFLRNDSIVAVGVQRGGRLSLLWLRDRSAVRQAEQENRNHYFAKRWAGVLERLAK